VTRPETAKRKRLRGARDGDGLSRYHPVRPVFTLQLRAERDCPDALRALKALLKFALRRLRLGDWRLGGLGGFGHGCTLAGRAAGGEPAGASVS
jgi:hypothetical protein